MQSSQDHGCWPTQYRNLVEDIGLIAKILTRHVAVHTGLGIRICPGDIFVSRRPFISSIDKPDQRV